MKHGNEDDHRKKEEEDELIISESFVSVLFQHLRSSYEMKIMVSSLTVNVLRRGRRQ